LISPHLVAGLAEAALAEDLAEAVFLNDLSAGGLVAGGLVAVTLDLVPGLPAFDLEARRFKRADPLTN
jgi:hypothetical protein